jgi:hypothetical protein
MAYPSTAYPSSMVDPSTADPSTADPSTVDPSTADPSTADPSSPFYCFFHCFLPRAGATNLIGWCGGAVKESVTGMVVLFSTQLALLQLSTGAGLCLMLETVSENSWLSAPQLA